MEFSYTSQLQSTPHARLGTWVLAYLHAVGVQLSSRRNTPGAFNFDQTSTQSLQLVKNW